MASTLIQDAVVRNLQTLSESTQRLSNSFKDRYPEMDWRGIAAVRNILVHDYLGIDVEHVWDIVEQNLPILKRTIDAMLKDAGHIV